MISLEELLKKSNDLSNGQRHIKPDIIPQKVLQTIRKIVEIIEHGMERKIGSFGNHQQVRRIQLAPNANK